MKKRLQFSFAMLVLLGAMVFAANCGVLQEVPWLSGGIAWGAEATAVAPVDQGKDSLEIKPKADEAPLLHKQEAVTQKEIDATVARATKVAEEYAAAIRSGELYGKNTSFTVATVALDAANPNIVGRGINGIWRSNPSIFNTTLTESAQITALYRHALTDQYLDELAKAEPSRFAGKDLGAIKAELAKLRAMLQKTKDDAAKAKKYYKNDPQEPSFESNWLVENCAEVWATRDAILQGAKVENIVIRTLNLKNGKIKALCRNCTRTFKDVIKAMD